jgi:hypothetical protein
MNLEGFWFRLEDLFFWGQDFFCLVKYLSFHNSSFALRYFLNINGKATMCDTPLVEITKNWSFLLISDGFFSRKELEP